MRISDWSSDVCSSDLHDRCFDASGRHPRDPRDASSNGRLNTGGGKSDANPGSSLGGGHGRRVQQRANALQCPVERPDPRRSEEHTSELQSLMRISYAVFCLKKKTKRGIQGVGRISESRSKIDTKTWRMQTSHYNVDSMRYVTSTKNLRA